MPYLHHDELIPRYNSITRQHFVNRGLIKTWTVRQSDPDDETKYRDVTTSALKANNRCDILSLAYDECYSDITDSIDPRNALVDSLYFKFNNTVIIKHQLSVQEGLMRSDSENQSTRRLINTINKTINKIAVSVTTTLNTDIGVLESSSIINNHSLIYIGYTIKVKRHNTNRIAY